MISNDPAFQPQRHAEMAGGRHADCLQRAAAGTHQPQPQHRHERCARPRDLGSMKLLIALHSRLSHNKELTKKWLLYAKDCPSGT